MIKKPVESGESERGAWKMQSIVVCEELPVPYPDKVRIDFSGERVDQLESIKEGDTVHVIWAAGVTEREVERDGRKISYISGYNKGYVIEKLND